MKKILICLLVINVLWGCREKDSETLLVKVAPEHHGISFRNIITENDSLNILTLEYIYNGGGVAVADFNNDGLSDIFFTGNMVASELYLNRGDLRFENVTLKAGVGAPEKWKSGVAVADVNGDGLKDIYVCATIRKDSTLRQNMLFINQGPDENGVPRFRDEAASWKVNYAGHSAGAAFLDYDKDNDLDLYIITNTILKGVPSTYHPKVNDGTLNADVLYRNNGDGTFTDVSREAGILHEGFGLGLAIADINQDGWPDIYVGNDYITNDLLYINNQDGTFTNAIDDYIRHQSQFSMGNDVADFNNDGLPDIITLDMLPEGNLRRKTVITGNSYTSYLNNEKYGYSHQYVRNVLQLNNGNGTFSEIGQLAGVHQTEWSWSPLFADIDNDGWKDLLITNGFPRDITDKDFEKFRAETSTIAAVSDQMDSIPVVKISNYAFRNNGDLTFTDMTEKWGVNDLSFSNGASFADLDNDGDLDYIVNNINDGVFLYENRLYAPGHRVAANHFLRIRLKGPAHNTDCLGAKVTVKYGHGRMQYYDHSPYRGYISSVEDIVHFGLDTVRRVDSLIVEWPDGKTSVRTSVPADQLLTIGYQDSGTVRQVSTSPSGGARLFREVSDKTRIRYVGEEEDRIDFNLQRTIPHKFSQSGPGLSVGDVNGDQLEDLFVGGAAHHNGMLYLQQSNGTFTGRELKKSAAADEEDQGALFFDADQDGDLDLYVVSGTFEYDENSPKQQDRLYINDGKGNFRIDSGAIPQTTSSGSCVRAADIDGDGDLDLFVGGRVIPGKYPLSPESYLLINESGRFVNRIREWSADLQYGGMITDAVWTDLDKDNRPDLVVAGEFMPLTVYMNTGTSLERQANTGLENFSGWWNSLAAADFDLDGDIDFVAGNLGWNNYYKASDKTPLRVYATDVDGNKSVDAILTCFLRSEDGTLKEYPVHFWDDLISQSPVFRKRFQYYKQYGRATIDKILPEEERKRALVLSVNHTASSYVENTGHGKFRIRPLPVSAQVAPVNGIAVADVNGDAVPDVMMVGNDYGNEVFTGRYDAFTGLVLLGDGKGSFSTLTSAASDFDVPGDAKALIKLAGKNSDFFVASQNRDSLRVFTASGADERLRFTPQPLDTRAELDFSDGRKQVVEFYYGSGYLSQSTRVMPIPDGVTQITVYNSKGESRKIAADSR